MNVFRAGDDHAATCALPADVAFLITGHHDGLVDFHAHADPAIIAFALRELADSLSARLMDGTAPGSGR